MVCFGESDRLEHITDIAVFKPDWIFNSDSRFLSFISFQNYLKPFLFYCFFAISHFAGALKKMKICYIKSIWQGINNHYSIQVAIAALYKKMWWCGTMAYNCGKSFWWSGHQICRGWGQHWRAGDSWKSSWKPWAEQLKARQGNISFIRNCHVKRKFFFCQEG